jgi:Domain of unknown function (DUF4760)
MEASLVYGTWGLAIATFLLVGVTYWMFKKQISLLREQTDDQRENLRLQNHLTFMARFDGPELQSGRVRLARQLLSGASHDDLVETVMNFFEDMGLFNRQRFLDEGLLWHTFGFYAVKWWAACLDYVLEERRSQNDPTLFTDFEDLVNRFRKRDKRAKLTEPSKPEIEEFLKGETRL